MITQGPFDLTLNQALPLNDPGATSNNPATAVQIQNASPFIVEVNSGGTVLTIQSFTAQTVNTSGGGQQMSVTPISAGVSGQRTAPASLTLVWLLAGESAPMIDGPLTASALSWTLYGAGIGGADIVTVRFTVASGSTDTPAFPGSGTFRLWNWGFSPSIAQTPPTKGFLWIATLVGSSQADDAISYVEGASNKLAGLVFKSQAGGAAITVTNTTDEATDAFIDYSVA